MFDERTFKHQVSSLKHSYTSILADVFLNAVVDSQSVFVVHDRGEEYNWKKAVQCVLEDYFPMLWRDNMDVLKDMIEELDNDQRSWRMTRRGLSKFIRQQPRRNHTATEQWLRDWAKRAKMEHNLPVPS